MLLCIMISFPTIILSSLMNYSNLVLRYEYMIPACVVNGLQYQYPTIRSLVLVCIIIADAIDSGRCAKPWLDEVFDDRCDQCLAIYCFLLICILSICKLGITKYKQLSLQYMLFKLSVYFFTNDKRLFIDIMAICFACCNFYPLLFFMYVVNLYHILRTKQISINNRNEKIILAISSLAHMILIFVFPHMIDIFCLIIICFTLIEPYIYRNNVIENEMRDIIDPVGITSEELKAIQIIQRRSFGLFNRLDNISDMIDKEQEKYIKDNRLQAKLQRDCNLQYFAFYCDYFSIDGTIDSDKINAALNKARQIHNNIFKIIIDRYSKRYALIHRPITNRINSSFLTDHIFSFLNPSQYDPELLYMRNILNIDDLKSIFTCLMGLGVEGGLYYRGLEKIKIVCLENIKFCKVWIKTHRYPDNHEMVLLKDIMRFYINLSSIFVEFGFPIVIKTTEAEQSNYQRNHHVRMMFMKHGLNNIRKVYCSLEVYCSEPDRNVDVGHQFRAFNRISISDLRSKLASIYNMGNWLRGLEPYIRYGHPLLSEYRILMVRAERLLT